VVDDSEEIGKEMPVDPFVVEENKDIEIGFCSEKEASEPAIKAMGRSTTFLGNETPVDPSVVAEN
jgi:hypothetical protein